MRVISFYDSLYCTTFRYFEEADTKAAHKILRRLVPGGDVGDIDAAGGLMFPGKDGIVIWCRTRDDTTLAHECFHATIEVMSSVDIPLTKKTEEAYAYYLAYLLRKIISLRKKAEKRVANAANADR